MEVAEIDPLAAEWNQRANRKKRHRGAKRGRRIAFTPDTKLGEDSASAGGEIEEKDVEAEEGAPSKKRKLHGDINSPVERGEVDTEPKSFTADANEDVAEKNRRHSE